MNIINEYNPNIHVPNGVIPLYDQLFNNHLIRDYKVSKAKKIFKLHREGNINFYTHRKRRKINKRKNLKMKLENNYYLEPLVYSLRKNVHKKRRKKMKKTK